MIHLYNYILNKDDPREYTHEALSGRRGPDIANIVTQLYNETVAAGNYDIELDHEIIIDAMIERMQKIATV